MSRKQRYLAGLMGILLLGCTGVMGAFTASRTFSNTLTTGNLGITLNIDSKDTKAKKEENRITFEKAMPGDELDSQAWIVNDRDYPLTLTASVKKPEDVQLAIEQPEDWIIQGNEAGSQEVQYVYKKTLEPGEKTSNLFDQLELSESLDNKEREAAWKEARHIDITANAVQLITNGSKPAATGKSTVAFCAAGENFYQTSTGVDLFDALKGMMPGETYQQTITLTNEDSRKLKFYLSSQVMQVLKNKDTDKGARYQIKVTKGSETLFDDEITGGSYQKGKEIYLGTLSKGQSQDLQIALTIVGESMGNEYQDAKGAVNLTYRTEYEEVSPTTAPKKNPSYATGTKATGTTTTALAKVAKTGDTIAIGFLILLITSGSIAATVILIRQKKSEK